MGTNEAYWQRAMRLIELGVTQKRIADAVGRNKSWVTNYSKAKTTPRFTGDMMDGLAQYERQLAAALTHMPPLDPRLGRSRNLWWRVHDLVLRVQ